MGIVLADDSGFGSSGAGTLDAEFILETNRIHDNERHGVWIRRAATTSVLSPLLRNNRIHYNGTVIPPAGGGPAGDGVRFESVAGGPGILASTVVHETIVNHPNGYGANNVNGNATPVLWNSIVYDNMGLVVPPPPPPSTAPWGGPDLFGFRFPPSAIQGVVQFSDFCGGPWQPLPAFACGSGPAGGPIAGCITSAPVFLAPSSPDFQLTCASSGATPPCTAACLSLCVDAADPVGPGSPLMPVTDTHGADRAVTLNPTIRPDTPDMGASEKQTCTP